MWLAWSICSAIKQKSTKEGVGVNRKNTGANPKELLTVMAETL